MKTLHLLLTISLGIVITLVIGNIENVQACTSYENCVRTLTHSTTQTASFNGNHVTYGIPYNLSNATLVTSLLDLPAMELIFELNATNAGQLMVELPRSVIDSTRNGNDKPYLIFVGDILSGTKRVKANEVQTTDTNRTLKINFTKNDNMIGIVGTYFIESNSTMKIRNGYGAWSPLQQYQKGFDAQDIVCKNEFILVIKTEDGFPACVKPDTAQKLVERGWGTFAVSSISGIDNQENTGTLSGYVFRLGGPRPESPQANYEVDVYSTDGVTIVAKTLTDANAHYSIQLPMGNYTIYVADYPTKQTQYVSVFSGKDTIFNILYGSGYK